MKTIETAMQKRVENLVANAMERIFSPGVTLLRAKGKPETILTGAGKVITPGASKVKVDHSELGDGRKGMMIRWLREDGSPVCTGWYVSGELRSRSTTSEDGTTVVESWYKGGRPCFLDVYKGDRLKGSRSWLPDGRLIKSVGKASLN